MAIIPGESIFAASALKPATFRIWCLLCEVKNPNLDDVYLELHKAQKAEIEKTAYYEAFAELEKENWIEFSRKTDGKKWWKLLKGFIENSANAEKEGIEGQENSANAENESKNSANAENQGDNFSANTENSANAEKSETQNSANAENYIRNIVPSEESQDSYESFDADEEAASSKISLPEKIPKTKPKKKPEKTRIPEDFVLTDEMLDWARCEVPGLSVFQATEDFIEYWTNRTDAKAEKVDWLLTWKRGMRLKLQWQTEDRKKTKESKNGSNQGKGYGNRRTDEDVFRESAEFYRNYPTES